MLGIAVASLYAYVGRKGIRSQPVPGTRQRLYWREDIERIARGTEPAQPRAVQLIPETRITLLTPDGHFYRGRSALTLAETASLEQVAALLWEQDEALIFPPAAPALPSGFAAALASAAPLSPPDRAASLFPLLEAADPRNYDRSPAGFARTGGMLLRWLAAVVAGAGRASADPIHIVLANAFAPAPGDADIIRRLLVLFADHELSPTTYAVRAVANTGATPYQAVAAGLLASKGQRIAEGRLPAIRRFLDEVLGDADPTRPVIERHQAGEAIPGFALRELYPAGDARARALLPVLEERLGQDPDFRRLRRAIQVAQDGLGAAPDLALLSLFMERRLRPGPGVGSLQIVGRAVGWIAHAREQLDSGPMMRPRAAYTGQLPEANMDKISQD